MIVPASCLHCAPGPFRQWAGGVGGPGDGDGGDGAALLCGKYATITERLAVVF